MYGGVSLKIMEIGQNMCFSNNIVITKLMQTIYIIMLKSVCVFDIFEPFEVCSGCCLFYYQMQHS